MELETDDIVDISPAREKFFGCTGKMLLPGRATLEKILQAIPAGQLATTDMLRKTLLEAYQVQAVCPVTLRKRLLSISKDPRRTAPYWRVVKSSGDLLALPAQIRAEQIASLEGENFVIEASGKHPRVKNFQACLLPDRTVWLNLGIGPNQL
jgi:hypothetical protein